MRALTRALLDAIGIVGVVVLLAIIGVIWLLWQVKPIRLRLLQLVGGLVSSKLPARIHVIEQPKMKWENGKAIKRYAEQFKEIGFEDIGKFTVKELPVIKLQAFLRADKGVYGIVYEQEKVGVWVDLVSNFEDETSLTASNAPMGDELDHRPGHDKLYDKEAGLAKLWQRFIEERRKRNPQKITREQFAKRFEKAWADEMDWRNNRGGPTKEEVQRIAKASGEEYTEEIIEATVKVKQREAREGRLEARQALVQAIKEQYVKENDPNPEKWRKVQQWLAIIHDQQPRNEVNQILQTWIGDNLPDPLPDFEPGQARQYFKAINAKLAEEKQFKRFGKVTAPVGADLYMAPKE